MQRVALPPRHYIAIFLLTLSPACPLIRRHDDATEVPDGVPWRGQLGHLDWAGRTTSWVLLVDTRLAVRPK